METIRVVERTRSGRASAAMYALAWLALVPQASFGQSPQIGDRIRVRASGEAMMVGTLVEVTPDDLALTHDGDVVRVPLEHIDTIERSLGEQRRLGRNLLLTTAVGALAVGFIFAVADDGGCSDAPFGCLGPGGSFVVGSVVGGIVSLPIGLAVGLAVRSERWEDTSTPVLWVSISAGRVP